jgi:hypothetical protein
VRPGAAVKYQQQLSGGEPVRCRARSRNDEPRPGARDECVRARIASLGLPTPPPPLARLLLPFPLADAASPRAASARREGDDALRASDGEKPGGFSPHK